jgi:adenylate kinase family enzyme
VRVHVLGASGSGTSTLAAALAERAGAAHLDTDDYFWAPTDPPFQEARPVEARLALLVPDLERHERWVLSGSLCGWGDPLIPRFELVVFLRTPTPVRLARLRERERRMFGAPALAPGGAMHESFREFIDWAASYDEGGPDMRSLARHEAWLAALPCPVLRLDGVRPTDELRARVEAALG